jgi:hypothetical protein
MCDGTQWVCPSPPRMACERPCQAGGACRGGPEVCESMQPCPGGGAVPLHCTCDEASNAWSCSAPSCPVVSECPIAPSTGDACPAGSTEVCPSQVACPDGSSVPNTCTCSGGRFVCSGVSCPDPPPPSCPPSTGACTPGDFCDGPTTTCPDGTNVPTHCECDGAGWACSAGVCPSGPPDAGGTEHFSCPGGLTEGNPCSPSGAACDQRLHCTGGGDIVRGCACTRGTWECDRVECPTNDV